MHDGIAEQESGAAQPSSVNAIFDKRPLIMMFKEFFGDRSYLP